jgi:hypothetical protein
MQLSQEEYNLLICATLKFLPSEQNFNRYIQFFQNMKGSSSSPSLVLSEEEIIRTLSTVFSTDYTDEMKEFFQKILAIEPAVSQKNQEKSSPKMTLTEMKVYERQILDAFDVCFQFSTYVDLSFVIF